MMNWLAPRISRYLAAAAQEVDAGDPQEATRLLQKLRPNRLNPYERALVYRMLAVLLVVGSLAACGWRSARAPERRLLELSVFIALMIAGCG